MLNLFISCFLLHFSSPEIGGVSLALGEKSNERVMNSNYLSVASKENSTEQDPNKFQIDDNVSRHRMTVDDSGQDST